MFFWQTILWQSLWHYNNLKNHNEKALDWRPIQLFSLLSRGDKS